MNHRSNHVLFGAYTLALMMLNAGALRALLALSRGDATASHLVFVPFVTLALLYKNRAEIFDTVRPAWGGTAAVLVGLLAAAWLAPRLALRVDRADGLTASIAIVVVAWLGGFLVCYGTAAVRAGLFPLLFLGFMIPIPPRVLEAVTLLLKKGSAEVVAGLFTVTGTPFHRDGYVFALPRFTIEIADECSGIRSSIALVLTGLLAGHLFLETGWKKVLLVAVMLPFAMLKNGFRIVSLSLLATYVDAGFIRGSLHHEGGIVFYLFGLAVLAPLFLALCNSERVLIRDNA